MSEERVKIARREDLELIMKCTKNLTILMY